MTAPEPGTDGQSVRPRMAQHYSVAPEPDAPEGYVAPGMPGAPVAGYDPAPDPAEPSAGRRRRRRRRRTGLAVAVSATAMLVGALAYGAALSRVQSSIGWLAIALAAAVAWPLGRIGGQNRTLPPLGALLSATGLLLGQLLGQTLRLHRLEGTPYGELLGDALRIWRADRHPVDLAFYGIALIGGFLLTRRTASTD
ncbi:hypothetical protein ACFVVX_22750 [Kitasatospora sp. NPDC058170]|uniref:hypothetical protein n=1 Tax=Kitasatospora sp. NPDC058170 TaxID=3346364 RepID=UPI0036DB87F9